MSRHDAPRLYVADLTECDALADLAPDRVSAAFTSALTGAGATVVEAVSHLFPGDGLTCVLILRESHAVLHTWPESGTVNIDIFSCSSGLNSVEAINNLGRALGASRISVREVARADGHSAALHATRFA